jgi:hypothetical protein
MSAQAFKVRWHWYSDTEGAWEVVEAPQCGGLQEGAELTLVDAQPTAWMWKHKVNGSEGCYRQHPATYGVDMQSPLYEWTTLCACPAAKMSQT